MENNYIDQRLAFFSQEEKNFYDEITKGANLLDKEKLYEFFAETLVEMHCHHRELLEEINSLDGLTPVEYANIIKNHIQKVYDSYAIILARKNQIEQPVNVLTLPGDVLN